MARFRFREGHYTPYLQFLLTILSSLGIIYVIRLITADNHQIIIDVFEDKEGVYMRTKYAYGNQTEERIGLLKRIYTNNVKRTRKIEGKRQRILNSALVPEILCPSPIRIGSILSNGQWICSPHNVPEGCVLYSIGNLIDITFEKEIHNITDGKCKTVTYSTQSFSPLNITSILEKSDGIGEIININLNKVNISDFVNVLENKRICQVSMDFVGNSHDIIHLLSSLSLIGYRLFHTVVNLIPNGNQYSLIHEDCLLRYSAAPLAYYLHLV